MFELPKGEGSSAFPPPLAHRAWQRQQRFRPAKFERVGAGASQVAPHIRAGPVLPHAVPPGRVGFVRRPDRHPRCSLYFQDELVAHRAIARHGAQSAHH